MVRLKGAGQIDHAHAHTTFKEQGATNKHQLVMVSETGARIFNKEAAYVAATRAKVNTEVITSDPEQLLRNAGKDASKLMALQPTEIRQLVEQARSGRSGAEPQRAPAQTPQKLSECKRYTATDA